MMMMMMMMMMMVMMVMMVVVVVVMVMVMVMEHSCFMLFRRLQAMLSTMRTPTRAEVPTDRESVAGSLFLRAVALSFARVGRLALKNIHRVM